MIIANIINFPSFYNFIKKEKMNVKLAYDITLAKKEIDFHLEFYESRLNEIILKFAQKDEQGNLIKTPDNLGIAILQDRQEECKAEIQELLNLEISYSGPKFNLKDFDSIEMPPEILEDFLPFIEM